ncbi:MAG: hypothetical protein A2754_02690 [Candidatus Magasanikbacteria bacterium RIFCSPHIGHO2_01_FULL_47_8]|uniref:Cell division protein FtsL n=1 Tax=Candidatus Magasanikbacteria bacterium RIFCSPHIGHO2_01_FULL_47_8 TaxID=1798673 RepID=A0A1F6MCQ1_9BACT|nr:MAG: hypothetical protein A2754_02690 [Candidatus Magasanikbacteria bacterium RIFCSPHIGHO2_01_FULL_47_8]
MSSSGENKLKTVFASRWFLAMMAVVLLLLGIAYTRAAYQNYQVQAEIKRLQGEAKRLEAKKMETIDALKYVRSNAYVEEKARTELNLVKEGEQMAVIAGTKINSAAGQEKTKRVESSNISNPLKWWNYFFVNNH